MLLHHKGLSFVPSTVCPNGLNSGGHLHTALLVQKYFMWINGKALRGSFFFIHFNLKFIRERFLNKGLYVDGISIAIVLDNGSVS